MALLNSTKASVEVNFPELFNILLVTGNIIGSFNWIIDTWAHDKVNIIDDRTYVRLWNSTKQLGILEFRMNLFDFIIDFWKLMVGV